MKTLSVRQPWATLLVSGIKDVENRTWAPNYKGRILIHASSAKIPKNFAATGIFEQMNAIENEQLFGNIPGYDEMDYSTILGYVTIDGDINDSTSIWADPVEHQWQIKDAYIFDEPIHGVKGKLNLFDTPEIDERHLPLAYKLGRRRPQLEGPRLILPITDEDMEGVLDSGQINIGASEEIMDLVEKPLEEQKEGEYAFKPISTIRFETPTRKMTFAIEQIAYQNWLFEDGTIRKMINWNMEEIEYYDLMIQVKDGLLDD
ncbi:MAG: ASCH domain-containing protein [Prevotella sp.]|jgi:hypothetical protein